MEKCKVVYAASLNKGLNVFMDWNKPLQITFKALQDIHFWRLILYRDKNPLSSQLTLCNCHLDETVKCNNFGPDWAANPVLLLWVLCDG